MDDQPRDYAVGYGKPPAETRFPKGQSGNPEGRPRGTKKLVTLLGEVLSQRFGLPNPDGSWMTKAEAIFFSLANQASSPDLKAKSCCSMCWSSCSTRISAARATACRRFS